jgi:hypothetical protein
MRERADAYRPHTFESTFTALSRPGGRRLGYAEVPSLITIR